LESKIEQIKKDFPTFSFFEKQNIPFHYLDNAATTLKPQSVIDKINEYYIEYPSNIHRGSSHIGQRAQDEYLLSKSKIAKFLNAENANNIIFTSGTTASSNLFSVSFAQKYLSGGDEIILTTLEHHSNLVNWMKLSQVIGFQIRYIPLDPQTLELDLNVFEKLLSSKVKLISLTAISNTLGVVTPLESVIKLAHSHHIPVSVDLAQAVSHMPIDLGVLDIDFAFFSAHKMFGPTGVGVFYAKTEWLKKLPPFFYGGGMVESVSEKEIIFRDFPEVFEAGTPPIAQAIALGASVDYINKVGFKTIKQIEDYLIKEVQDMLTSIEGIRMFLPYKVKVPIFSFLIEKIHPHDVATILEEKDIATRTGKHCTEPLINFLGVSSTVRVSLSMYNNKKDIEALRDALNSVKEIFYGY
jgi:cysteine desulfurase/selenocysteine lyase